MQSLTLCLPVTHTANTAPVESYIFGGSGSSGSGGSGVGDGDGVGGSGSGVGIDDS